jgi:hypothetical protein
MDRQDLKMDLKLLPERKKEEPEMMERYHVLISVMGLRMRNTGRYT